MPPKSSHNKKYCPGFLWTFGRRKFNSIYFCNGGSWEHKASDADRRHEHATVAFQMEMLCDYV